MITSNSYHLFGKKEIERLRVIRMLSKAAYSHRAILRMFIELDSGNIENLHQILDIPRADEDIFTAADHWLSTLTNQEKTGAPCHSTDCIQCDALPQWRVYEPHHHHSQCPSAQPQKCHP